MKKIKFSIAVLSIFALTLTSCSKDEETTPTDNSPMEASASIDAANELDIQTGNEVSNDNLDTRTGGKNSMPSCPSITQDPETTSFPLTYYVDYGTGCTKNNIVRKGKLKITFTAEVNVTGSIMTVERMSDYYVNGNKVEGTIVYENTTETPNIPQWTRTVTNGKFTNIKGKVFLNSGTHTVKQTDGVGTPYELNDNVYELIVGGKHTVTKEDGGKIVLTVTKAVIKSYSCDYVSKGEVKVESALLNGTVDYGNGDCDNNATYTQNGVVYPFKMVNAE